MRSLSLLLLAAAAVAAAATPALGAAGGRRALAAAPACKTWIGDVLVSFKVQGADTVVSVINGRASADLVPDAGVVDLGPTTPLCVPVKFSSYSIRATAYNELLGQKVTSSMTLIGAGLASAPNATGECAAVLKPTVKNVRVGGMALAATGASARVCRPCAAGQARNVTTGACAAAPKPSPSPSPLPKDPCNPDPCAPFGVCSVKNGTASCFKPCDPSPCKATEVCAISGGKAVCFPKN